LRVLDAKPSALLPRIYCYFDDIVGFNFGDYNGERLAISEFNEEHSMRKLAQIYGLKHFVPPRYRDTRWVELFYMAHIFDHPMYCQRDQLQRPTAIDMDGNLAAFGTTDASNLA